MFWLFWRKNVWCYLKHSYQYDVGLFKMYGFIGPLYRPMWICGWQNTDFNTGVVMRWYNLPHVAERLRYKLFSELNSQRLKQRNAVLHRRNIVEENSIDIKRIGLNGLESISRTRLYNSGKWNIIRKMATSGTNQNRPTAGKLSSTIFEQSCTAINCLSSGINILAGGSSVPLISKRKGTDPHWKHVRCTHFDS